MKKNLIIINPCSGKKKANRHLTTIVDIFTNAGYITSVLTTTKQGDETMYAACYGGEYDVITAIGGDGTFNEVVAGVLEAGNKTPIGYIPAGSTNDFASSLGLSTDIIGAAKDIVNGEKTFIDIGSFNGRKFSYVASFGAFTQSSYATPQSVKNMLGHLAYVLDGVTSIASIKKEHISVEADGQIYEDDYIFGAISNSTSLAGIITLKPEYVDMNDGMFELLLVKSPKNIIEMTEIVNMLMTQNYESNMLTFINAKEFKIHAGKDMPWSLDGEFQEGSEEILVENLHSAIEVFIHKGME